MMIISVRRGQLLEIVTYNKPMRFWIPWRFASHSVLPSRALARGGGLICSVIDGLLSEVVRGGCARIIIATTTMLGSKRISRG